MPVPPKKTKGGCKRVTGERVLTSTEELAILKERDKKLREAKEKQKRKEKRERRKRRLQGKRRRKKPRGNCIRN